MSMITQNNDLLQAIDERVINEIPIVHSVSGGAMYVLLRDLPEKATKFIQGESFVGMEVPVLPDGFEKMVMTGWRSRDFICTYCRQSMEYMKRDVIIRYLHVKNPETGVSICLIPWFMLPRKRFPVQVYAFAAWYDSIAAKPVGVIETAGVVKELFGLETFDPSTVSRSKAQMARIFREHDGALSDQEPDTASTAAILDWVTEALTKQAPVEPIKCADGMKATGIDTQPMPATAEGDSQPCETQKHAERAAGSGDNEGKTDKASIGGTAQRVSDDSVVARVLGNIPHALAEVKKPKLRVKYKRRERPPRERGERLRPEHKEIGFVESPQLEKIRNDFTKICKNIVLNAALTYHKLLNLRIEPQRRPSAQSKWRLVSPVAPGCP